MISQERSRRKKTGGLYRDSHKKKLRFKGSLPTATHVGERKIKKERVMGGNIKVRLLRTQKVNLYNPETRKSIVTTIKNVIENPANRHYARRNILTKGAIIETDKGKARVTNRPGQEGTVNAILIK